MNLKDFNKQARDTKLKGYSDNQHYFLKIEGIARIQIHNVKKMAFVFGSCRTINFEALSIIRVRCGPR